MSFGDFQLSKPGKGKLHSVHLLKMFSESLAWRLFVLIISLSIGKELHNKKLFNQCTFRINLLCHSTIPAEELC